jgi:hypothetical protein
MTLTRPTVNQINGFVFRNPVLKHYLQWKENINRLNPAWSEDCTDPAWRSLPRKTLRGNCMYGNLLKTVAAFAKIDITKYNYHRDNLKFELDVQWNVKIDVDGVWISAQLPWNDDKDSWSTTTFVSQRMRAKVPFDKELLQPIIKRYNEKYFFPDHTLLGLIQIRYKKSKKQAIEFLKTLRKENKKQYPVDIDDSEVQKSMARKLKRAKNIKPEEYLSVPQFNNLMARERAKTLVRAKRFDTGFMFDFEGDVDEIENEFYSQFEDDVVYID